ncbi:MAG: transporter [Nitrospira sp.]|nr:transporter [Nitrospira sp.]
MTKAPSRWPLLLVSALLPMLCVRGLESPAEASCGSVSCFVIIGSQQQVSPAGMLIVNLNHTYTPNEIPPSGVSTIPFANQQTKQLILANSQVSQLSTLVQTTALDLNYGLTERLGLEVLVPYKIVDSVGQIGAGAVANTNDRGIGDVLAKVKYNLLPTLRSMVVLEMGVYFPTGDYGNMPIPGQLAESTLQVGRGAFGVQPGFYQTYEIVPHRVNQVLAGNWRHTARNSDGYQFGDEYTLSAGVNIVTWPWLTLTEQVNFRHKTQDNIEAALFEFRPAPFDRAVLLDGNIIGRDVPTTDHTFAAFSTGLVVNAFDFAQVYFIAQIPFYRDFNGNLQQATSYVFGMTKAFATTPLF